MEQIVEIQSEVRDFVVDAFLYGEDDPEILSDTNLVERGVVDSINVLQLVEFMEESYDIMLEPEDLFQLISIANIAELIEVRRT